MRSGWGFSASLNFIAFESSKGKQSEKRKWQSGRKRQKRILSKRIIFWTCAALARPCWVRTRCGRAECRVHLLFSTSRRPHCVAVVCWFLLRGCVFRPDHACQKRFSWFPDWIQKVQTYVNLVDFVKSFQAIQTSISHLVFACKIWRRYSRERASQSLPRINY